MTSGELNQWALVLLNIAHDDAVSLDNALALERAAAYLREQAERGEQGAVAEVQVMATGGNAGIATRIVEIDNPLREPLRPGDKLYAHPAPQSVPDGHWLAPMEPTKGMYVAADAVMSTTLGLSPNDIYLAMRDAYRPAAPEGQAEECQGCNGTGQRDSGGVHPWGEAAMVPCDCSAPAAPAQADAVEALRKLMAAFGEGADYTSDENAPGHAHERTGIWDDDNSAEIAGKPCELCAAWNYARAALAAQGGGDAD